MMSSPALITISTLSYSPNVDTRISNSLAFGALHINVALASAEHQRAISPLANNSASYQPLIAILFIISISSTQLLFLNLEYDCNAV